MSRRDEIRTHVLESIASGAWPPGSRAPSESELMAHFGVSRMTAHHAIQSLSAEGYLDRVKGLGTFVAQPRAHVFEARLQDVALEIAARGGRHSAEVIVSEVRCALMHEASLFGLPADARLLHAVVLHLEDDVPIQIEDRLIDPALAPAVVELDPAAESYFAVLMREFPYPEGDCVIRAVMPDAESARLLRMPGDQPCLQVERVTRVRGQVLTVARLLYPASRHVVSGRFVPPGGGRVGGGVN